MTKLKKKVLFVCMGNICRSPTAHGVFRSLVEKNGLSHAIEIDSAGTHAYHIGEAPDPRSVQMAQTQGVDLSDLRARKVTLKDFETYDFILAMDIANHEELLRIAPLAYHHKISLFLTFSQNETREVPDPYYGGKEGFTHVFKLVTEGSLGLLSHIKKSL